MKEAHTGDFVRALSAEKLRPVLAAAKGVGWHLPDPIRQSPAGVFSLSLWENRQEAEAFFASPDYLALVVGVREYLATVWTCRGMTCL